MSIAPFHPFVLATALACLLAASGRPAVAQETADPSGFWRGEVVFVPSSVEFDVFLHLEREGDAWRARVLLPSMDDDPKAAREVAVEGGAVRFSHEIEGSWRPFRGELSDDGGRIEGEFGPEGRGRPFVLRRQDGGAWPTASLEIRALAGGIPELAELFDGDRDRVRLLLLLSPTCDMCRVTAEMVRRYVLSAIPDEDLRAYVVWVPIRDGDDPDDARLASRLVRDDRVVHLWAEDTALSDRYGKILEMKDATAWDVVLLFSSGRTWNGVPPTPDFFMHQRGDALPADRRLNGQVLAERVRELLGGNGAR